MEKLIQKWKRHFRKGQKGITLLEILAVLVIIALVFIALSRNLGFGSDKAKTTDVQQAFKPYQVAFENALNENSGVPLNGANASMTSLNRYLGAEYQLKNAPVDDSTAQLVKLKDPWNKEYQVQAILSANNGNNGDLFIVRTAGKDKKWTAGATPNLARYSGAGDDSDDLIFVSHYKDGSVKSCTKGLEKNVGSTTTATFGVAPNDYVAITGCQ